MTWKVIKLNRLRENYSEDKVADAIFLAAQDVGGTNQKEAWLVAKKVTEYLTLLFKRQKEISTKDIGDAVERILIENHHVRTAKAYIINRDRKREELEAKIRLGVVDDVGLPLNSLIVFKNKYLGQKTNGDLESPGEVIERIATALVKVEKTATNRSYFKKEFARIMKEKKMFPGGRTIANAGTINNQLANCFVLPFPDDIEGIFEIVKESSILKKNGGAVGFSFSNIRPKGDLIKTTSGRACGPVALMSILNEASNIFLQAGGRRSGNMVTLSVAHPDVFEFIGCKESGQNLPHINYSLSITDNFMKAVEKDIDWQLINPHNGQVTQTVRARSILEQAARLAWKNGDPGVIFIDTINKNNPTPEAGKLETVNLCGEQPLLAYEACNLGSINLVAHVKPTKGKQSTIGDGEIDWQELKKTTAVSIRMLDNVVSVCTYPINKIDQVVKANRKIGLGVMGWADLLIKMGIAYGSEQSLLLAEKVMKTIQKTAWETSEALGKEKGNFDNFRGSIWEKRGYKHFRNATTTTIAPTGSISMIAGCSYGIEPLFAVSFVKKVMNGYELPELNDDLVIALKRCNGVYSQELIGQIANLGSIQTIKKLPNKIKEVFVTAMDINFKDHVRMQAAFQKYTDNAVSKTINMPTNATVDEVYEAYLLAWKLKCKGITVYRDKSRKVQVLNVGGKYKMSDKDDNKEFCPECGGVISLVEGCASCNACGYSRCSL